MQVTTVALVATVALATLVANVTDLVVKIKGFLVVVPQVTMKKRPGWHLRPFSETLKRKCGGRAKEEGKPEYQWVTEVLCKELGITVESLSMLDSKLETPNENGQGPIRRSSPANAKQATKEKRKDKG